MQKIGYRFFYYIVILLVLFTASCSELYNHSLGNHLSLWDGDEKEDRIVVYCEGNCHGGIYVVPTYERHYDVSKQNYTEYVETAASDKEWVIVKTLQIKEKKENYWIISKEFDIVNLDCSKYKCDNILQSYVTGPLSLTEFENKKKILGIGLNFE